MNTYKEAIEHGLYFNGVKLVQESIDRCIDEMISINKGCINEVASGEVRVNDNESYFKHCNKWIDKYKNRDFNISLTILQHAYYIQTNESVALLP